MTTWPGAVRSLVVFAGHAEPGLVLLRMGNEEFRVPLGMLPQGLRPGEPLTMEVWKASDGYAGKGG
jgi:hypothetical protein